MPRPASSGTRLTRAAYWANAHRVAAVTSSRNARLASTLRSAPRAGPVWPGPAEAGVQGSRRKRAGAGTVTAASTAANSRYVPRQPRGPASAEASGAKIVLANPAASVRVVSAATRRGPYQVVSAANAGG